MTITAKNIGRINVWPTYDIARAADTGESEFIGQLTVWRTPDEARANILHEEEGGGGEPDWVPENAVIHIDLVGGDPQGRAWVQGTGEVAVDTLLGSDPDSSNAWDDTEYDPENLSNDGYATHTAVAIVGAALLPIIAGSTMVFGFKPNNYDGPSNIVFPSSDGNAAAQVGLRVDNGVLAFSWNGTVNQVVPNLLNNGSGPTVLNRVAVTFTPTRLEVAVNGSAAFGGVLVPGVDFPEGSEASVALVNVRPTNFWQYLTVIDPLPSTAGLSELSEVT